MCLPQPSDITLALKARRCTASADDLRYAPSQYRCMQSFQTLGCAAAILSRVGCMPHNAASGPFALLPVVCEAHWLRRDAMHAASLGDARALGVAGRRGRVRGGDGERLAQDLRAVQRLQRRARALRSAEAHDAVALVRAQLHLRPGNSQNREGA